jgi:hypothetical protein
MREARPSRPQDFGASRPGVRTREVVEFDLVRERASGETPDDPAGGTPALRARDARDDNAWGDRLRPA